jgi:acetyl-CoA carboxylase carboxyl transferase subunit alpha
MVGLMEIERPVKELEGKIAELKNLAETQNIDLSEQISTLEERAEKLKKRLYKNLTPWQKTQMARHPMRPYTLDYAQALFDEYIELHGDRCYGDDKSIVGGFAKLDGRPVVFIGHQKGRNTRENIERNFGSAHPEGYRKAMRLMEQAERFKRPILTFIDTQGAFCGIEAEERGNDIDARIAYEQCGKHFLRMLNDHAESFLSAPFITEQILHLNLIYSEESRLRSRKSSGEQQQQKQ